MVFLYICKLYFSYYHEWYCLPIWVRSICTFFYKVTADIFSPVCYRVVLTFIFNQAETVTHKEAVRATLLSIENAEWTHRWKSLPSWSSQSSEKGMMGLIHEFEQFSQVLPLNYFSSGLKFMCSSPQAIITSDCMDLLFDVLFQIFCVLMFP